MPREYSARLIAAFVERLAQSRPRGDAAGPIGRDIDTTLGKGGATLRFVTSNGSLNIRER
jgi:hypothetical protein